MKKPRWFERLTGRGGDEAEALRVTPLSIVPVGRVPVGPPGPLPTPSRAIEPEYWPSVGTVPPRRDGSGVPARQTEAPPWEAAHAEDEDEVPSLWRPGETYLGKYEVLEILGAGGMGVVYKVRHAEWGIDMAVKCPRPEALGPDGVDDFRREAEVWVGLGLHPNVATCYSVRTLGGIPRLFAELVERGSLADVAAAGTLYDAAPDEVAARVLGIVVSSAYGLAYAHSRGIVHQDVKPANMLVTGGWRAKVSDFGLARAGRPSVANRAALHATIAATVAGGTPAYRSPEQAEALELHRAGKGDLAPKLTRRTDLWSWALTVVEVLAGERIWGDGVEGRRALERLLEPERPRAFPVQVPSGLVDVLEACLRPDPKDRPDTAAELVDVLRDCYRRCIGVDYGAPPPSASAFSSANENNRALALLDIGLAEEAERVWEALLARDPGHLEATFNLGLRLWRTGRLSECELVARLERARRPESEVWLADYLIATVALERGDFAGARARVSGAGILAGEERVSRALATAERLAGFSTESLFLLKGHDAVVTAEAITADGAVAATGDEDGVVRTWDVVTGAARGAFSSGATPIRRLALSQETDRLVALDRDGVLRILSLVDGRVVAEIGGAESKVREFDVSPSGRRVATLGGEAGVTLWDLADGKPLGAVAGWRGRRLAAIATESREPFFGSTVCFVGDDTLAVLGAYGIWHLDLSGRTIAGFTAIEKDNEYGRKLRAHESGRYCLLVSRSVAYAVDLLTSTAYRSRRTEEAESAYVHDVGPRGDIVQGGRLLDGWSRQCLATLSGGGGAFSADSQTLIIRRGGWGEVLRLGITRRVRAQYAASVMRAASVELDEATRFRGEIDRIRAMIEDGDVSAAVASLRTARASPRFAGSSEAAELHYSLYARLRKLRPAGLGEHRAIGGGVRDTVAGLALSPDARRLVTIGRTAKVWELSDGRKVASLASPEMSIAGCCSDSAEVVAFASFDGCVRVYSGSTGDAPLSLRVGEYGTRAATAMTRDGAFLVTGGFDTNIRLWSARTGALLRTSQGHPGVVVSVAIDPTERFLLSGGDGVVRVWDWGTSTLVREFETDRGPVTMLTTDRSGRMLVAGTLQGGLYAWDLREGSRRRELPGHTSRVTGLALTADGRFAVSSGVDPLLRICDLELGEHVLDIPLPTSSLRASVMTPDGKFAVAVTEDETVDVWSLEWTLDDRLQDVSDARAVSFVSAVLEARRPRAGVLPLDRQPTPDELELALTRSGRPRVDAHDLAEIARELGFGGVDRFSAEELRTLVDEM